MSKISGNFPLILQELKGAIGHTAKSVGPTSKLVYLGLEIDSVKQVVSIPETKNIAIIQKVKDALQHTKITLS